MPRYEVQERIVEQNSSEEGSIDIVVGEVSNESVSDQGLDQTSEDDDGSVSGPQPNAKTGLGAEQPDNDECAISQSELLVDQPNSEIDRE